MKNFQKTTALSIFGIAVLIGSYISGIYAADNQFYQKSIYQLMRDLDSGVADVQIKAAWALGERENDKAVPTLINALEDNNPKVRAMAAWALGEIKDKESLPDLMAALDDSDDFAREMIVKAVGELENPQSVAPLKKYLRDRNPDLRFATVWALGEVRTKDAMEAVSTMQNDENPFVRKMAIKTLQRPKKWASGATAELYPILSEFDIDEIEMQAKKYKRQNDAINTFLTDLKDSDPETRILAAYFLGRIGSPEALDGLFAALNDTHVEVRFVAVWALDEINPSRQKHAKKW